MIVNRGVSLNAIFLSGLEVFNTMSRRRVHDAGSLIERDVIGQHCGHAQIQKWVLKFQVRQILPLPWAANARSFEFHGIERRSNEVRREQQRPGSGLGNDVVIFWMK